MRRDDPSRLISYTRYQRTKIRSRFSVLACGRERERARASLGGSSRDRVNGRPRGCALRRAESGLSELSRGSFNRRRERARSGSRATPREGASPLMRTMRYVNTPRPTAAVVVAVALVRRARYSGTSSARRFTRINFYLDAIERRSSGASRRPASAARDPALLPSQEGGDVHFRRTRPESTRAGSSPLHARFTMQILCNCARQSSGIQPTSRGPCHGRGPGRGGVVRSGRESGAKLFATHIGTIASTTRARERLSSSPLLPLLLLPPSPPVLSPTLAV